MRGVERKGGGGLDSTHPAARAVAAADVHHGVREVPSAPAPLASLASRFHPLHLQSRATRWTP